MFGKITFTNFFLFCKTRFTKFFGKIKFPNFFFGKITFTNFFCKKQNFFLVFHYGNKPIRTYNNKINKLMKLRLVFYTHLAFADFVPYSNTFQGFFLGCRELFAVVDDRQPKAESVGEIVARATLAVTFDEWSGSEVFQTRTGTSQCLAAAFSTGCGMLQKKK